VNHIRPQKNEEEERGTGEQTDGRDPLVCGHPPVFYYFCPSFIDIWPTIKSALPLSLSLSLILSLCSNKHTNIVNAEAQISKMEAGRGNFCYHNLRSIWKLIASNFLLEFKGSA
jgi:hypothetical protein